MEPGYGLTVIPLQYMSGATLVRLMEGFAARPGTLRTDLNATKSTLTDVRTNTTQLRTDVNTLLANGH